MPPVAPYIVSDDGLPGLGGGSLICSDGDGDWTTKTCENKGIFTISIAEIIYENNLI